MAALNGGEHFKNPRQNGGFGKNVSLLLKEEEVGGNEV
jgi:hypothetical protein